MKEKSNIDDLFKNSITGYKIEPADQVWQNVKAGFFGKKGFAYYKWYFVGAATLFFLLTAGSIWYFNNNIYMTEPTVNEVVNQGEIAQQSVTVNKPAENKIESNQLTATAENRALNKLIDVSVTSNEEFSANNENTNNVQFTTKSGKKSNADNTYPPSFSQYDPTIKFLSKETQFLEHSSVEGYVYTQILSLDARTIRFEVSPEQNMIDPEKVTGMASFLEKQRISHFYTGALFTAGMVYYPSTKDQFTWSADLIFGLTAGKFYFETGVGYQDMKERGIYAIDLKGYDSVGYFNEVESFEIDPQNPEEILYNTNKVTVYDSLNHYTHTTPYFKYKYINVPLTIGFKFFSKQKFTASVSTGVSLSMLVERNIPESDYYDPEYTVVRIRNMTPERVEWNMLWMMSIRLNYKIFKSLSISAEPVFTKYLNSIYDTGKGYSNIKPYTMNLRVGLYYGF